MVDSAELTSSPMSNEQMANEILIDQYFQFVDDNCSAPYNTMDSMTVSMHEKFQELFWSLLEKEVTSTPPDYTRVIKVVHEICFNLGEVKAVGGLTDILNLVDFEDLKDKVLGGTFEWTHCVHLLRSIRKVIVKVQGNTTEHGWEEIERELDVVSEEQAKAKLFCAGLKLFFDHINVLRLACINRRLRSISAVISMEGAKYLSQKFQEKLDKGSMKLDGVKSWLKAQMEKVFEQDRSLILNDFEKMTEMLRDSIVNLVWDRSTQEIPVTLYLDRYRIQFARENLNYLCTACSVILYLKTMQIALNEDQVKYLGALRQRVLAHYQHLNEMPSLDALVIACNEGVSDPEEQAFVARFIQDCPCLFEHDHRLQLLVRQRICNMWKKHITGYGEGPMDISSLIVLQQIGSRHLTVAKALRDSFEANLKVHGPLYRTLLATVVRELRTPALIRTYSVIKVDLPVENSKSVMQILFYPKGSLVERYTKANVGLLHAVPGSEEHRVLVNIRHEALEEGGFDM